MKALYPGEKQYYRSYEFQLNGFVGGLRNASVLHSWTQDSIRKVILPATLRHSNKAALLYYSTFSLGGLV